MTNHSFPTSAGPLVGAAVGALISLRVGMQEGKGFAVEYLAGGAALGLLAGLFVWALDPAWSATSAKSQHTGTLMSRLVSLLSVLLCCIPLVGLGLGIAAVVLNRDSDGWPRRVAGLAILFSGIVTFVVAAMVLAPR